MAKENTKFLNEVNESKDFWNIKVKIIKKWTTKWSLDVILMDEQGTKIQGYVKEKLMKDFTTLLQEDSVVVIKNCGVGAQDDRYPVVRQSKKIIFYKSTEVKTAVGWSGYPYGYVFTNFEDINEELMGKVITVDIIGCISWCGNLDIFKSKVGQVTRRINLDLQNLEGTILRCTFWGDYAVQVSSYVAQQGPNMEQIVMVVQHGKIKLWNGIITVQNDMFGTRIFLDEDIVDFVNFRKSLLLKNGGNGNSQSRLTTQTNYPARNEFITNAERKTIDEIREIELVRGIHDDPNTELKREFVVLCTIKLLEEDQGWYYPACRKCKKKIKSKAEYLKDAPIPHPDVEKAPADSLWCPKCNCQADSVVPKFRIQFRVQDTTGSVSFIMFDTDVFRLAGVTANDIRERQMKSINENRYPHELDVLLNRQVAFKIQVTNYNVRGKYYVYTVNKVCDDPDIIAELMGQDLQNQGTPDPTNAEGTSVKLSQSSQAGVDSKDVASVTGGFLAGDVEKDSGTSPLLKRPGQAVIEAILAGGDNSETKRLKKKLEPYDMI